MKSNHDIVIVGGGMVGASLACALGSSGLRVALVEATPLTAADQPSYDERTITLGYGSKRIFEALGVWAGVVARGVAPIKRIHVSERGRFGVTRLEAADLDVEALGFVTPNRTLGVALYEAIGRRPNIALFCPGRFQSIQLSADTATVHIGVGDTTQELRARLVVAADGANSQVRTAVGISAERHDYGANAVVTHVTAELAHRDTAYERFTPQGPLALLPDPGPGNRMVVIVSAPRATAAALHTCDQYEFLHALQEQFGERLGKLHEVGARHVYPLYRTDVPELVRARLVLAGNAAHTVHPVAGQGFNLGLRDVAVLAEMVCAAAAAGNDIGELPLLQRYADGRSRDQRAIARLTDNLIRIFTNDIPPLALARNLGLIAVDLLPPAKRRLLRITSGMAGRLPRLVRAVAP